MVLVFIFALLSSKFATNSAFKTSTYRLPFLDQHKQALFSRKKIIQIQGKKVANDGDERNVKKIKNRKRWITDDSLQDVENLSRPDVLQIAQLYEGLSIPDNVRARLSITEEALLIDIVAFRTTYPKEEIPIDFYMRNERVKVGGELMGNEEEKEERLCDHRSTSRQQLIIMYYGKEMIRPTHYVK